jgi:hypothetical protein
VIPFGENVPTLHEKTKIANWHGLLNLIEVLLELVHAALVAELALHERA